MRYLLFLLFILTACATPTNKNTIYIRLSPEKLLLEQREIEKEDFLEEFKLVVRQKMKEGIKKETLKIDLQVNEQTRREDIADIEFVFRRLDVRTINYTTFK